MNAKYLFALVVALTAPLSAEAQQGSIDAAAQSSAAAAFEVAGESDQQQPTGPMKIERVHSGVLLAPDFKVTRVDGRTSELVGGYGGWLTDRTLFIGGGGYWLANGSRDRRLGYGGLVVQWMGRGDQTIGYSIKGLVGGGESTLSQTVTETIRVPELRLIAGGMQPARQPQSITTNIRTRQAFFVAEPEADVVIRITNTLRLTAGAGYRLIAAERGNESRLRGPVGTIGIQLGGGY